MIDDAFTIRACPLRRFQSVLSWSARVGWVVTAVAVSQAMNPLDSGVTATFALWILWIVGAVAVFVGSPLMLTLARTTLPLGPVAAKGTFGGDSQGCAFWLRYGARGILI